MVFQSYALYPHMTVRENLAFALKLRGSPKAEIEKRVQGHGLVRGVDQLADQVGAVALVAAPAFAAPMVA